MVAVVDLNAAGPGKEVAAQERRDEEEGTGELRLGHGTASVADGAVMGKEEEHGVLYRFVCATVRFLRCTSLL